MKPLFLLNPGKIIFWLCTHNYDDITNFVHILLRLGKAFPVSSIHYTLERSFQAVFVFHVIVVKFTFVSVCACAVIHQAIFCHCVQISTVDAIG